MLKGKVRWFSDAFGYGFIEDERGNDIFVHYSVILKKGYRSLEGGEEVSYERAVGPKGEHATIVIPDPTQVGAQGA
jgi:CspA family cold shock protein